MIPYGKQNITEEDIKAVTEALKGDFLTQGPTILAFEKAFSDYIGCKYSVAVSNGTAALHLSALALGVNENSKVLTTPLTFAASANCIRYCGGQIVFSDIDEDTYLIDIPQLQKVIESHPKGTFSGIIPVDFAGRAVNLEALKDLADQHNLWILEDACHAPGGYFIDSKGIKQNCGNGKYADLAIFSFHPVKHIATGEGGMITTNDEKLYQKLLTLRTHGITRDKELFENTVDFANGTEKNQGDYPGWYMEMKELGYNYRFTDFQAALGISQLKRANQGIERRTAIAVKYYESFIGEDFIKNQSGVVEGHAYHLYVIKVKDRLGLYNYLREQNIFAQIHYIPCHLMPYYKQLGWKTGDLPVAEAYYKDCISLPMYPTLTEEEQDFVIRMIKEYYV
ncbi:UDP-4-amino-4,6-dideoxy-N-acetyl-beta-L-altrosamine transaminase [Flavobacterium sp. TP390]|uniref:UDP-4-amino-4, 6-dideoxy-N-acetyl-beta-L-altrosamine transaminase n=1 Tax=Flavobacterium profundi TaxID=1774945 RepID=A0A6I4IJ41_9FLAO|nr:UDP-4-amino-4,6-dideoxy-N-acetyl-beta-L-altrosamine transaminase [Flavobacterium profundi]MVO07702.1 UDP-4-amino-4,6-dideoxy-N-acetyl-beta-L-altrosamine transaminase [Flavobacterium profundi]